MSKRPTKKRKCFFVYIVHAYLNFPLTQDSKSTARGVYEWSNWGSDLNPTQTPQAVAPQLSYKARVAQWMNVESFIQFHCHSATFHSVEFQNTNIPIFLNTNTQHPQPQRSQRVVEKSVPSSYTRLNEVGKGNPWEVQTITWAKYMLEHLPMPLPALWASSA